jgi:hypothetical protein
MAIVHYTINATKWAITKYQEQRANNRNPVLLSGEVGASGGMEGTLTVGKSVGARWNVLQTVGKSIDLRWSFEAPTPSLARRLEELASWLLHVP